VTSWRWGQNLGQSVRLHGESAKGSQLTGSAGRIDVAFEESSSKFLSYTGAPINMTEDLPQSKKLLSSSIFW
jgi:hypothetical protein